MSKIMTTTGLTLRCFRCDAATKNAMAWSMSRAEVDCADFRRAAYTVGHAHHVEHVIIE